MGIIDKINKKTPPQTQSEEVVEKIEKTVKSEPPVSGGLNLTTDELEFVIRLIGSSNFKGNNLMFIYELVKKLQEEFLKKSGGK